jgi:hypothetical protein
VVPAALGFAALTVVVMWPLVRHVGSSLPADLGDPLFVTWVMGWVARHLTALLSGDLGAFARMWDAPIFAPEAHTLAYSEHFTGQTVLALPVWLAGGGPIAAYNTAFLASYWLSAVGAFVLVRALTGHTAAALVAGTFFGFNAYRVLSVSHLHTLSTQWVPLVLAGVLAFARSGSPWALAGAAAAYVATAWSSLYHLAYFSPCIGLFALIVLARHDAWRRPASGIALAIAGAAIALLIVPFLQPYLQVQQTLGITRLRSEVEMFSFPLEVYLTSGWQLVPMLMLAVTAMLAWRPARTTAAWVVPFFAAWALLAFWLSLGPTPRWLGAPLGIPGLYSVLFDYVPGFSGLRVASRFTMVLMLALSILAGMAIAAVARRRRRLATAIAAAAMTMQIGLFMSFPLSRDTPMGVGPLQPVPASLDPAGPVAPIYHRLKAATDPAAVVVELPFGEAAYELRYMYAGLAHERRLLNGYSGVFPASYRARLSPLRAPWNNTVAAWAALEPATHAVVHGDAWEPAQADAVVRWLAAGGARLLASEGHDSLWQLPRP